MHSFHFLKMIKDDQTTLESMIGARGNNDRPRSA